MFLNYNKLLPKKHVICSKYLRFCFGSENNHPVNDLNYVSKTFPSKTKHY